MKQNESKSLISTYEMLMDMCLPKFDIYQGTMAFSKKSCLMSGLKFTLPYVT